MRLTFLILVFAAFGLQGCEQREGSLPMDKEAPEKKAAEPVVPGETVRVAYDVQAGGRILDKIDICIRQELGALDNVTVAAESADWELRVVAKNSEDFRIYCESLITLSSVFLQKSGEGTSNSYRVRDHQVTTIQSENLESACRRIVENFKALLPAGGE